MAETKYNTVEKLHTNTTLHRVYDVLINAANDKTEYSMLKENSSKRAMSIMISDIALVFTASFIVTIGSYLSLTRQINRRAQDQQDQIIATGRKSHTMNAMIILSAALITVYTILSVLIQQQFLAYITGYFYVFGVLGLFNLVRIPFSIIMPTATHTYKFNSIYYELALNDVLCFISCAILGTLFIFVKHWITNDICGLVISISAIELLPTRSFEKLCMFMCSTLFYFGSMIYIFTDRLICDCINAISGYKCPIDGPYKLLFPRDLLENGVPAAEGFNTLSFADIIIPGILMAFLLRFGQSLKPKRVFYYFIALFVSMFCLELNLLSSYMCTSSIPAFIIIVPACFFTTIVTTLVFGHFKALIRYDDDNMENEMNSE